MTIISVIRESRIRTVQRPEVNTAPTTASTQLAEIMKFMVSTFYCLAEDYHSVTIISVIRESRIRTVQRPEVNTAPTTASTQLAEIMKFMVSTLYCLAEDYHSVTIISVIRESRIRTVQRPEVNTAPTTASTQLPEIMKFMVSTFYCLAEDYHSVTIISVIRESRIRTVQRPEVNTAPTTASTQLAEIMKFMVSTFYCLAEDYHSVTIISVIRESRIRTVQRPEVNTAPTTASTQLAEIMKFMVSTLYCLAEDYHSVTIISVIRESRIRTVQRPEVNTAPTTASTQLAEIMKFMVSTFYCLAEDYHSVTIISVIRESRIRTVQRPEVNTAPTTASTQLPEIMKFMVSTLYCLAEDYHSVTIISVIRESRIRTVQRPEVNTAPTTASTQLAEIMKFMVSTLYCLAEDYHSVTIISVIRESRIRTVQRPEVNTAPTTASTQLAEIMKFMVSTFYCLAEDYHSVTIISVIRESRIRTVQRPEVNTAPTTASTQLAEIMKFMVSTLYCLAEDYHSVTIISVIRESRIRTVQRPEVNTAPTTASTQLPEIMKFMVSTLYCLAEDYHSVTIISVIRESRIRTVQRPEVNTAPTTASTQLPEIMKFMVSTFYCLAEDYHSVTIISVIRESRIRTVQRPEVNTAPTTASTQLAEIMKFMVSTFYCLAEDYHSVTIISVIRESRIRTVQRPEVNTAPTTASTQLAEIMKFMVSTFYCLAEDYHSVTIISVIRESRIRTVQRPEVNTAPTTAF